MNLRRVLFKKWVPIEYQTGRGRISGTGCFEKEYTQDGFFHKWGNAYQEFDEGPGNYCIAIVELPDGTVVEVLPGNLKFVQ